MLILLPPSEGKTPPAVGPHLDFATFKYREFNSLRREIAQELCKISVREDALEILRVGAAASNTVRAQADLFALPCAPAHQIYTGVLYNALDFSSLTASQQSFAEKSVIIFSGLFGVLGLEDLIPIYRLTMGTKLPLLGNTKNLWKQELHGFDIGENELIIDCRSGNYQVWDPPKSAAWITITAEREVDGRRKVVSHNAKHYRGMLTRALITQQADISSSAKLHEFAQEYLVADGTISKVELHSGKTAKSPEKLVLIQK
ncbi:peroxide stress protein YaaA [Arcanobacterium hippocoleae]|uniref:Cytoplasmic iron level regulating protein YaaA (DUF328/UPF0246 family) n=1 Tax=Arcanobacterium hippocoleae TaxID=149017 RepID=A0ABU1T1Z8_9ACTO|nr:peroxide stress protein YaaA [Arcanobacterium hippocoleae]MDR6938896.1 cytoplasmic iron level regulating protein YaaA (DUF328/UPF0246 family) [Arcanobacterium hippocoleae]